MNAKDSRTPEYWEERERVLTSLLLRCDTPTARRMVEDAIEDVRRYAARRRQSHGEAVRP